MARKAAGAQAPTMEDLIEARGEAYAAAEARAEEAARAFEAGRETYAQAVQAASSQLEALSTDLAVARVDRDRMIREADQAFDEGTRAIAAAAQAAQA